MSADLITAIRRADPQLSRYNPLPRILFFDDFDQGANGWCELVGNHDGDLNKIRRDMHDLRPPQISNCSFFDIGTHGSVDGTYALKLATRARRDHVAVAIKRLTYVQPGQVQFETYFTFKSEQTFDPALNQGWDGNYHPSESHFGHFTLSNDICEGDDGRRYMCVLRYVNADAEGRFVRRWMYKTSIQNTSKMLQRSGQRSQPKDFHAQSADDWQPIPGGEQSLCYNEVPTKVNWHYLRWVFDTRECKNVELQVNDLTMDLRDLPVPAYPEKYVGLAHLFNFLVDVQTNTDVRNFLFLDSVLVSVDW